MKKERIDNTTAIFMLVVAGIFDGVAFAINLIPVIGQVAGSFLSVSGYMIMAFWLTLRGAKLITPKVGATAILVAIFETFPLTNFLPGLLVFTGRAIFVVKSEDKLGKLANPPAEIGVK